jgi:hypothetical protein
MERVADLASLFAVGRIWPQRQLVHRCMIAHVHHESVEAVRADGGEERIEHRVRSVDRAGAGEVIAHEHEVCLERGCAGICGSRLLRPTRVPRRDESPRCLDTRGHEAQLEPYRLISIPLSIRCPDFGREGTVSFE